MINRRTAALVIGAWLVLLSIFGWMMAENTTGADVAAIRRGGCPEGYTAQSTMSYGWANGNPVLITQTQCLPDRPKAQ